MPRQCRLKPESGFKRRQKTGGFPPVSSLCPALRGGRVRIGLRGGARCRAGVPPVRQNISRRIKTAI
ncbi:hypothetical protein E4K39_07400 [Neisseria meningitidis]|uniref:Uncharacterized protein n=1 Tax=Neisseria meningitidis serogroup B / serotype 15 (strain H44/76) TaxID=909420 RepID=E6MYN3_NEIMH|nr:hypothetical protein A6J49_11155 [Neisseria meningitidis]EFV63285.1 hypothetical protein NMH_1880 [Neisseria meningitidis H44/76]ARC12144.1 hypothetical protein A6J51_05530 [Neisseria meningitidis]MBG8585451.1 hypothetical protein [Neisseria meningitidis]MBG8587674.1 hypothetical protein [Neisseria meningitidis]